MFDLEKPWKIVNNVYLLFDIVHLMKSIRNNQISEKLQELSYDDGRNANWKYIKILYENEKNAIVNISRKPIECQNVSLCLKFFSDGMTTALKLQNKHPDDTIELLPKLVTFFKIANVKGQFKDVYTKDETTAVLSSPDDERLNFLISLADMIEKISCERQGVNN